MADKKENKKMGLVYWLIALYPFHVTFIPIMIFVILYLGTESVFFLIVAILLFVLAALAVIYFVWGPDDSSGKYVGTSTRVQNYDAEADISKAFFAGFLTGNFITKTFGNNSHDHWWNHW